MESILINEIHQLVDNCSDNKKLKAVKELLVEEDEQDWWDELSKEEQNEILETSKRVDAGIKFSDEHAQNIFKKWREK